MLLNELVAIVTGGATGIGKAIALKLAGEGANIFISDINQNEASNSADEISKLGVGAASFVTDVSDTLQTQAMVKEAINKFGKVDILINNAGVAGAPGWYERSDSTDEDWNFTFGINVRGLVNVTNSVVPYMKEERDGKILNIASIAGREGRPSLPHYSSSKAAVINYTQSLAGQLGSFNINVNAICPGLLWTPMWEQVGGRYSKNDPKYLELPPRQVFEAMIADNIPRKREQTPEDVGDAAVFLVSDNARNITGQSLNVDGGFFMR